MASTTGTISSDPQNTSILVIGMPLSRHEQLVQHGYLTLDYMYVCMYVCMYVRIWVDVRKVGVEIDFPGIDNHYHNTCPNMQAPVIHIHR